MKLFVWKDFSRGPGGMSLTVALAEDLERTSLRGVEQGQREELLRLHDKAQADHKASNDHRFYETFLDCTWTTCRTMKRLLEP